MTRPTYRLAALALTFGALAVTGCSPSPVGAPTTVPATISAEVIAVVDGDTIDVATENGTARVRLIGIDTPEIGRDGKAGECYADEARDFLDQLLYGRTVQLHADATQADVDKYGRLLRYVLVDGQSAAELAIAAGGGYEYTYDLPYVDQETHRAAQDAAEAAGAGLWSAC